MMTNSKNIYLVILLAMVIQACSFGKKVKTGEMAYERKQYAIAIDMLHDEYENEDVKRFKARKAYLLGMSYSFLEENKLSIEWLKNACRSEYGNASRLALARAYKKNGKYNLAIKSYEILKRNSNNTRQLDREIYVIKEVAKWANDVDQSVKVELMSENTGYSEYSAIVLDDNILVFTSDRDESTGNSVYNWTGNKHTDLFVMLKYGSDVKRFDAGINSNNNEGSACFSKDGLEMVFTRCYVEGDLDGYCKLMYSERFSGVWTEPKQISGQDKEVNYGQSTFIEGDTVLVFSAQKEDGFGGHDLYYIERLPKKEGGFEWSSIDILPQTINTSGNEMFPSGDGDTLYFSSDYLAGLGGLDIFKTWIQPNGQWAPPMNMKKPINSSFDDFSYFVDHASSLRGKEIEKGYFTSTRKGYGKEDIYRFERSIKLEEEKPEDTIVNEPIVIEIYLAGITKEKQFAEEGNPNSEVIGMISLADCYILIKDGETSEKLHSDKNGRFIARLEKGKTYTIKASKLDYLNEIKTINTKNLKIPKGDLSYTINEKFVLSKIYSDMEITLQDIYYNFNKWDVREDAKPALDSLAQLLINNPQISIQLSSHTDCRGDFEYNEILSQKRAQSAVNYIISKGVNEERLVAKGYGENIPDVDCKCDDCTEEDYQKNRRTTFKILK